MSNLLPHEMAELRHALARGMRENDEAAADMAEAVDDPNVYHDNAAYDEVIERMKLIDGRYGPIAIKLAEAALARYPEEDDDTVMIGSFVRVDFGRGEENVAVVGLAADTDIYVKALNNGQHGMIASAESPVGMALTGAKAGDDVTYKIGDREVTAKILGINQTWIRRFEENAE